MVSGSDFDSGGLLQANADVMDDVSVSASDGARLVRPPGENRATAIYLERRMAFLLCKKGLLARGCGCQCHNFLSCDALAGGRPANSVAGSKALMGHGEVPRCPD